MKKHTKIAAAVMAALMLAACSHDKDIKKDVKEAVESGLQEGKEAVESGWNDHKDDITDKFDDGKKKAEDFVESKKSEVESLLSTDKLFEIADINPDEFKDLDWEKFINTYLLDEKDLKDVDINTLINDFTGNINSQSIDFLVNGNLLASRKENFTTGIVKVCYFDSENGTSVVKVVDYSTHKKTECTLSEDMTVKDLLTKSKFSAGQDVDEAYCSSLTVALETSGLFEWETKIGDTSDSKISVVVEYQFLRNEGLPLVRNGSSSS